MVNKEGRHITEDMEHYKKIQRFDKAVGYMAISAICITFLSVFAKLGMQFSTLTLFVFLRFFVPLLISLIFLIPMGVMKKVFKSPTIGNQFVRGIAAVSSQYFLFFYLTKAQLFNAMMLWNTTPIFIPLVSWVLYRHHIGKATWVSVILGILGVACVIKPDGGLIDWFSIWGILAGVATAFSQVLYGQNRLKDGAGVNIFFIFFTGSIYSLIGFVLFHVILEHDFIKVAEPVFAHGLKPYLFILLLSLSSIGNQYFKGMAYTLSRPSVLSPFFYLSVVFAGLMGWIVFNHIPDYLAIMGMVLIVFASIIRMSFSPATEQ